jgi:hypothetical protein
MPISFNHFVRLSYSSFPSKALSNHSVTPKDINASTPYEPLQKEHVIKKNSFLFVLLYNE